MNSQLLNDLRPLKFQNLEQRKIFQQACYRWLYLLRTSDFRLKNARAVHLRPSESEHKGDFVIHAELYPISPETSKLDNFSYLVTWPQDPSDQNKLANKCILAILKQICDTDETLKIIETTYEELKDVGDSKLVCVLSKSCTKYSAKLAARFSGDYPCGGELYLITNKEIDVTERIFKLFDFCNWELALELAKKIQLTETTITIGASSKWKKARPNLPDKIELLLDSKSFPSIEYRDPSLDVIQKDLTNYDLPW